MKPFRWVDNLHLVAGLLMALALVGYACCLGGCANWEAVAVKSLTALEHKNIIAAGALRKLDAEKQPAIVAAAKDLADGQRGLEAWRAKWKIGEAAIAGSHAAVVLARDGIRDIKAGLQDPTSAGRWIAAALNGARNMLELLRVMGVKLPEGI